jgi:hypothetical protein
MLSRTIRSVATLMLAAGAVGAAGACEASRIAQDRVNAIVRDIGRGSFSTVPSVIIVRLAFADPDAAPVVETVYAGGESRYAEGIIAEAKRLRLPCATSVAPVQSVEMYRVGSINSGFREAEPKLKKDLQLAEVVRLVKGLKSQTVKFDLREMSCPFAVRFSPYQPYLANTVVEVGQAEASRAPFLEWLRNVSLDIPKDMMVTAIGRESMVAIPCAVLDLS